MKKSIVSIALASTLLFTANAMASLSPAQQKQLNEIQQLLENNPDIISDLHASLNQYVESQTQFEQVKQASQAWLNNTQVHSVTGNPNGNTVLINFTDYNCPYCKKLEAGIDQLVKEYNDVKVINIYVPLQQQQVAGLDTNSAIYALNVWQKAPDKFAQVHALLVAKNGRHTKESLEAIAKKTNTAQYLVANKDVEASIIKNLQTFTNLGLRGTPAIFVGDDVVPGFIPYAQLKQMVEKEINKNS